jgi:hypothetical protein
MWLVVILGVIADAESPSTFWEIAPIALSGYLTLRSRRKRRDRHRQPIRSPNKRNANSFHSIRTKSYRSTGTFAVQPSLFFIFQCATHLRRREKDQTPNFHEGNTPGFLLVPQPAQGGPTLGREKNFEQLGAINELLLWITGRPRGYCVCLKKHFFHLHRTPNVKAVDGRSDEGVVQFLKVIF